MHPGLSLPTSFVHGFQAEDWAACWNTQLAGTLVSIDFANEIEFGKSGVRDTPMADLRNGDFDAVFMAPRTICLMQAGIIHRGGLVGEGVPPFPTRLASSAENQRVVRQADIELRMEEMRRDLAPEAPSRIGCLYLADDSPSGRTMVSRLKGPDAFLMQVKIAHRLRVARIDTRWLDGDLGDQEFAGYWSGEARGADPLWEYLLDGIIECTDAEELELLERWGPEAMARASGTQGPIGVPRGNPVPRPRLDSNQRPSD